MVAKRRRIKMGIEVPEGTKLVAGGDGAKLIGCSRASFYRLSLGDPQFPIPVGCNARGWSLWKLEDLQQYGATWRQQKAEREAPKPPKPPKVKKVPERGKWADLYETEHEEEE